MALSESVETSLKEAEASLRNALAYAARQERPLVCKTISTLIADIDQLMKFDNLIDKLEERLEGGKGQWGPFGS
jgi:benzoyl-CoA reductase/2-hydroxyglutaryl-CoA dehydratase subunit BcrC/BadD/HgdB